MLQLMVGFNRGVMVLWNLGTSSAELTYVASSVSQTGITVMCLQTGALSRVDIAEREWFDCRHVSYSATSYDWPTTFQLIWLSIVRLTHLMTIFPVVPCSIIPVIQGTDG